MFGYTSCAQWNREPVGALCARGAPKQALPHGPVDFDGAPRRAMSGTMSENRAGSKWWNVLLVVPFLALLPVTLYNRLEPSVFGIPFFYWYQFLWVVLTSLIIVLVDNRTRDRE